MSEENTYSEPAADPAERLKDLARWYATPSGLVLALGLFLLLLGLLPVSWFFLFGIAGIVVLAAFFPLKFRGEQARSDMYALSHAVALSESIGEERKVRATEAASLAEEAAEIEAAVITTRRDLAERIVASERSLMQWSITARSTDRADAKRIEDQADVLIARLAELTERLEAIERSGRSELEGLDVKP